MKTHSGRWQRLPGIMEGTHETLSNRQKRKGVPKQSERTPQAPSDKTQRNSSTLQKSGSNTPSRLITSRDAYPTPSPTPLPTDIGFHFFWACCINLVGAGFLRLVLSAPRPFMYDQRLRPLADRYETSHGLPSLETHMATVVAGWWAESGGGNGGRSGADDGGEPLVRLIAVSYICFVGFTRSVSLRGQYIGGFWVSCSALNGCRVYGT